MKRIPAGIVIAASTNIDTASLDYVPVRPDLVRFVEMDPHGVQELDVTSYFSLSKKAITRYKEEGRLHVWQTWSTQRKYLQKCLQINSELGQAMFRTAALRVPAWFWKEYILKRIDLLEKLAVEARELLTDSYVHARIDRFKQLAINNNLKCIDDVLKLEQAEGLAIATEPALQEAMPIVQQIVTEEISLNEFANHLRDNLHRVDYLRTVEKALKTYVPWHVALKLFNADFHYGK